MRGRPTQPGLQRLAEDLWVEHRALRFLGVETGTRMTVVRLADGGLFVHSPVSLRPETREAVDALGPVRAVVAPSLFHHLSVGEWMDAHPEAGFWACPGLEHKRADLVFNLARHPSRATRTAAWLLGNRQPGATLLERVMIRDRKGARDQVDRMLAWNAERLVLGHGPMFETDASGVLRRAYAWL